MDDFKLHEFRIKQSVILYLLKVTSWMCIASRKNLSSVFVQNMYYFIKSVQNIFDIHMSIRDSSIRSAIDQSSYFPRDDVLLMFNVHEIGYEDKITKSDWAYPMWYIIHSSALAYSTSPLSVDIKDFKVLLYSLCKILPCEICLEHTRDYLLKNSIDNTKKNYLMLANWISGTSKKDKDFKEVEKIITIISQIRSFKNELNVSPGSFVDISLSKINANSKAFFKHNDTVLKKLGRINNFFDKDMEKPSATIVISGDIFKVYFEENVDLKIIKENLLNKQKKSQNEIDKINSRLNNKDFISRAPKHIVDQEKTNYNNLKNDIKKISLTVKSL